MNSPNAVSIRRATREDAETLAGFNRAMAWEQKTVLDFFFIVYQNSPL